MRTNLIGIILFFVRVFLVTIAGAALIIGLIFGFGNTTVIKIIPEIGLAMLSVALITTAVYQVLVHETEMACMSGMMVGMTTGMLSGFLLGYLAGATNGLFVGSLVGVVTGAAIGAAAGRCCGIMGIMEGVMAGLMAGTMGPMLSVMLLVDKYRAFTWVFVGACAIIFAMLSVMVEREFRAMGKPATHTLLSKSARMAELGSVTVTVLIVLIMVLAPRGPLTVLSL